MRGFNFRVLITLILSLLVLILVGCASDDEILEKPTPKAMPKSIEDNYSIKLYVYPTPISENDIFSLTDGVTIPTKSLTNEANGEVLSLSSESKINVEKELKSQNNFKIPVDGKPIKLPSIHISGKRQTNDLVTLETTPFREIPFTHDGASRPMIYTDLIRKDDRWKFTSSAVNSSGEDFGPLVGAMDATWSPDGKNSLCF